MKAHDKGNGSATQPATTNVEKKAPPAESKPETNVGILCSLHVPNLFK